MKHRYGQTERDWEQEQPQQLPQNGVYPLKAMKILKITGGIVCWIFALLFFLGGILNLPFDKSSAVIFVVPAIFSTIAGWVFVSRSRRRISGKEKAIISIAVATYCPFIIVILVPDFVAAEYQGCENPCVNNLRQLQAAKEEWALENGETNGTFVTVGDITPYVQLDRNGNIPKCPEGGTYILGRVGEDVRCSLGTSDWPYRHVLSDTNDFTWEENVKGAYSILLGWRHVKKP